MKDSSEYALHKAKDAERKHIVRMKLKEDQSRTACSIKNASENNKFWHK